MYPGDLVNIRGPHILFMIHRDYVIGTRMVSVKMNMQIPLAGGCVVITSWRILDLYIAFSYASLNCNSGYPMDNVYLI